MARDDYKDGWAVVDDEGLKVKTVSDTRRAAIINWLMTEAHLLVLNRHTDEQIEAMWDANRGDSMVRPVRVYVQ